MKRSSAILSITLAFALIMAGFAIYEMHQAQSEAKIIRVDNLAAQSVSLRDVRFDLSLLLAIEAYQLADTTQTRGVLLDSVQANPQLIQYLQKDIGSVNSVAFSPDGRTLASGYFGGKVVLWDVATRQPLTQLFAKNNKHGLGPIYDLTFSPDGKMLIAFVYTLYADERIIALWDVATGQPINQPSFENKSPYNLIFSPDGKTLVISEWGNISFWDMQTSEFTGKIPVQPFEGLGGLNAMSVVSSPVFSDDGKTFAAITSVNVVTFWDVSTLKVIGQPLKVGDLYSRNGVNHIAFSQNGKTLLMVNANGALASWDLATRQPISQLDSLQTSNRYLLGYGIVLSPDTSLVAVSDGSVIDILDVQTGRSNRRLPGNANAIGNMAFRPDGKMLASAADNGIILWDLTDRQILGQVLSDHGGSSMTLSSDGKLLASDYRGSVIIWNVATRQPIERLGSGNERAFDPVAFSPDSKILAAGNGQGITLWEVTSGKPIGIPLSGKIPNQAFGVTFSPNGKMLAFDGDGGILLWDIQTRQQLGQPLIGNVGGGQALAFSPDGKILAAGDSLHTTSKDFDVIRLWNVSTRQIMGQPLIHSEYVYSITFSPDGKTLASSARKTITFWDVSTQTIIGQPFRLPTNSVATTLAFSPDGKTLAFGNYDNRITLLDVETHQPIGQGLLGNIWPVDRVAFTPDGNTLATTSDKIILWDMNPQSWIDKICQRVGRNFTRAEWAQYFPGESYHAVCSQWPLEAEPTATPVITP